MFSLSPQAIDAAVSIGIVVVVASVLVAGLTKLDAWVNRKVKK